MPTLNTKTEKTASIPRPPVVAVMGHIDHGKTTLLDYIRHTLVAEKETGGITQRVAAYEIIHKSGDGKEKRITFLDTPGHEAFTNIRFRGAAIADIAVLVVSAEDGVKPQTVETLKFIKECGLPFLVAITKIDKPNADTEKTKQSLAEHEVYLEGYGGTVPFVPVSGKTGEGITELLDMISLMAEVQGLTGNPSKNATGIVLETALQKNKGVGATLIIKDGVLKSGMTVTAGQTLAPIRLMEDSHGKKLDEATFSSPVTVIGWNQTPKTGSQFFSFATKKGAEFFLEKEKLEEKNPAKTKPQIKEGRAVVPLIIKTDVMGSLEAAEHEIKKLETETVAFRILQSGTGDINESDAKLAAANGKSLILGFNVGIDKQAKAVIERAAINIKVFDIIYKLVEFLQSVAIERTPKVEVVEIKGKAKILKIFSSEKDKQIIGGRVLEGTISLGDEFKIFRREAEIGKGKIRELQRLKVKASEIQKDGEFGAATQSSIEIAPGDRIESFVIVKK